MRINSIILATLAAVALAGCKTDLSEITDEQLVTLLGNGGRGDKPAQITAKTRECAEVLGGINAAVYQDLPAELLGMVKTDCRKRLQGWLDDPARNSTELTLEDFERADLAERIVAVAEAQQAALAEHREAELTAEREALKAKLAEATAALPELKAELQERRDKVTAICANLADLRDQLDSKKDAQISNPAKNAIAKLMLQYPGICRTEEPFSMQFAQIERFEDRLGRFELPEAGAMFTPSVPAPPCVDFEDIDEQIVAVEAATAEYQAALAEN